MIKTIALRGKKQIVAVYSRYAQLSGNQDTSRPQATADFIEYISKMPLDADTEQKLRRASKQRVDESTVPDTSVPSSMKITVEIEESMWEQAMKVFKYVFALKGNPQMPYFLRVAGMAYIHELEEQNADLAVSITKPNENSYMSYEDFKALDIDRKLNAIYNLLLKRAYD